MKLLLFFLFSYCSCVVAAVSVATKSRFKEFFDKAVAAALSEDYQSSATLMKQALIENPQHVDGNQLLGTVYLKMDNAKDGAYYLKKAAELDSYQDLKIISNYIEALRADGQLHEARNIGNKILARHKTHPVTQASPLYFNLAIVENELQDFQRAVQLLQWSVTHYPENFQAWKSCSETLIEKISPLEGELFIRKAMVQFPDSHYFHFMLGVALHHQKKLDDALHYYYLAEKLNPQHYPTKSNIAAALHSLGKAPEALRYYEATLPHITNDPGLYNNYGALLGVMGRKEEEVVWLKRALELDPTMEQALVNLGGYCQDEGQKEEALEYLNRAVPVSPAPEMLKLRMALIMSPISSSWENMLGERKSILNGLESIARDRALAGTAFPKTDIDTTIDRIHFYVQYHGLNDRTFQETVVREYLAHINGLAYVDPRLSPSLNSIAPTIAAGGQTKKARVAFISKFFGLFEPHGLLLDGVMKYLPRTHFTVIACPVARTDLKPLSPRITEVVDEVAEISLTYAHALETIRSLNVDLLVFADSMSEPVTHFFVHGRFAKIQVLFWGNPITSGSHSIDYFVSADVMEHPFRNRMAIADEPYTEQVVTMEGQGIWYEKPVDPDIDLIKTNIKHLVAKSVNISRADFDLSSDWFVFLLPQSVFKIHPTYDRVLADILQRNPSAHLVVTGGRRPRWSEVYLKRLQSTMTPDEQARLHMIDRVSSEKFDNLLLLADVILHPFPFDGSKTAADALNANKPLVTLPTEYLRGRMGLAFLKTMNMPELVARNVSEYVDIATRLCADKVFYHQVVKDIKEKVDLIWEDMEVPYTWTRFLSHALDIHPVNSFESFVRGLPGKRDAQRDLALHRQRVENRLLFDKVWGEERYMLDGRGVAVMESMLNEDEVPRIFNNWKSSKDNDGRGSEAVKQSQSGRKVETVHTSATPAAKIFTRTANYETNHIKISPLSSPVRMGSIPAEIYVKNIQKRSVGTTIGGGGAAATGPSGILVDKKNTVGISMASDATLLTTSFTLPGPAVSIGGGISSGSSSSTVNMDKQMKNQAIMNTFRSQLQKGRYKDALTLGISLFESLKGDPLYLLEMGATHYFSGEYQPAFEYCTKAAQLAPDASLVHSCVGVAAMYLPQREKEAIDAFQKSLTIMNKLQNQQHHQPPQASSSQGIHSPIIASKEMEELQSRQLFSTIFTVTRDAIEGNLIHCYQTFRMFEECLDFTHTFYGLPPARLGGAFVLAFSAVDWSAEGRRNLALLEQQLRDREMLALPVSRTLISEIVRVQKEFPHIINSAVDCLAGVEGSLRDDVYGTLMNLVNLQEDGRLHVKTSVEQMSAPTLTKSGIALIAQYYEPKDAATLHDLNIVLTKNLANPAISEIYLLNEKLFDFSSFPNAFKIQQVNLGQRLTFKKAFEFANDHLPGRTVMLANSDVYFDYSLTRLDPRFFQTSPKTMISLLKWKDTGSNLELTLRTDSQDAWIFSSPIDAGIPLLSDFHMGIPRCDNRLAQVFHTYNYTVIDPVFAIHAIEVQSLGRKGSLYGTKDAAFGSGRNVLLSDQFVF